MLSPTLLPPQETRVLNPEYMRQGAQAAVALLKLLANEDRLMLLCQLTQGEFCVGDLERLLGIRQPTLSQQLAVLRAEGAVNTRREGKNVYYSIANPQAQHLLLTLHALYCPDSEQACPPAE